MIQLYKITRDIWEQTRFLNIGFKRKEPALKRFFWPCWNFMLPEIRHEYLTWISYLIKNDLPDFSADERHQQAVENRIQHGWQLEDIRDDGMKFDPYLKPLAQCPDWFQTWCNSRDNLMKKIIKEALWNHP
jgi:hypothetical protein